MNIREGVRRALIIVVMLAEAGWGAYVANVAMNSYGGHTDDFVAWLIGAVAIPIVAFAGWKACDWIMRGFRNSN
ncbi:MAG: hypothetical protein H0W53_22085 [Acidobacteria bacterium]|nr:hypothetical protein [Acidobacteriota bacterium]